MGKKRVSNADKLLWLHYALLSRGDECIDWPFGASGGGYGRADWNGRQRPAHHLALMIVDRDPPVPPLVARHLCGRRICVNTNHLAEGTHEQNSDDREGHGTMLRGESHPMAKVSDLDVERIRHAEGTQSEVAARFGVSQRYVSLVRRGEIRTGLPQQRRRNA